MVTDDIKFIKTDKEGDNLRVIQENYPNSIIDVNSQSEKNVYIGNERITDNYNLGVDENSVTNNVGGMTSGINASELKGKSVSEILDIILFANNHNLALKGVQVVDRIGNLYDGTLKEVYQGMVVSVIEANALYILLTDPNNDSDSEIEWKKVGSDINIEELKTSTKKLSAPITVAGLDGGLGHISNGKVYTINDTIEDILRDLLCKEIYPNVRLSTVNPSITFGGMTIDNSNSNYESIMKVGSKLNLGSIVLKEAKISGCSRQGTGFIYGYSVDNKTKNDGNPSAIEGSSSLVGDYTLTETYTPAGIGKVRTSLPSGTYSNVRFDEGEVVITLGSNKISITATSPSGEYTHPKYPEYYVVSNLGNTNVNKKLAASGAVEGVVNSIDDIRDITVKGVYPLYVNIKNGKLVKDTQEMELTESNIIVFDEVPSEVESQEHFKFDYPETHEVTSFEIWSKFDNMYVNYAASYEKVFDIVEKDINGNGIKINYNRFITTGSLQGKGKYKITLSKRLDEK
jgi:uncharacterized protein YuzE